MRTHFKVVLAAASCLLGGAAWGGDVSSASLFNGVVVAKGQGVEVRRGQLDDAFVAFQANLAARGQNIPEDKRLQTEAQLLDRLIVAQLLVQKATVADKAKAKENTAKFLDDSYKAAGSEEAFLRQLKVLGITPQQFTNRVTEQAIAEELLGREVKSKIIITAEQLQQFYETNEAAFLQPETADASHILVLTRDPNTRLELTDEQKKVKLEKAEKALVRARKGEDFSKLIQEFSEDSSAKDNKGEFRFTRAKDDPRRAMVPEFENAAFALKPGEISSLVKTDYGYHIIKLQKITPPQKTSFIEASDKIREVLINREMAKQIPDYFGKLKKEAKVEILDEKLKEVLDRSQNEPGK